MAGKSRGGKAEPTHGIKLDGTFGNSRIEGNTTRGFDEGLTAKGHFGDLRVEGNAFRSEQPAPKVKFRDTFLGRVTITVVGGLAVIAVVKLAAYFIT